MDPLRYLHPVLPSRRLRKKPVQVEVAGQKLALFRDGAGRPAALADACPHRLAPLSLGHVREDGRLQCSYHGWRFDGSGRGECPTGATKARCDTVAFTVLERHGYLWVANPGVEAEPPPLERDGYRLTGSFSMRMPAPLPLCLDNFSENEHVPFVHTRLGWDEAHLGTVRFEAHNFEDRTEVSYRAEQRWSPVLRLFTLRPGDCYHNQWVTRFDPVRTEYSIQWTAGAGDAPRPLLTRSTIFMVPETERTTWFHVFVTTRIADGRRWLREPLFRAAANLLGWWEVRDDCRFLERVADCPQSLEGMKLGLYDKPVIHNRKLLEGIYWGERSLSPTHRHPGLAEPAVPAR